MGIDELKKQLEQIRSDHELTLMELSALRFRAVEQINDWLCNWPGEYARSVVETEHTTTANLTEEQLAALKRELQLVSEALPMILRKVLEASKWPQSSSHDDFHPALKRHLRASLGMVGETLKKHQYLPYPIGSRMSSDWEMARDPDKPSEWALAYNVGVDVPPIKSYSDFAKLARKRDELMSSIKDLDARIKREEARSRWDSV